MVAGAGPCLGGSAQSVSCLERRQLWGYSPGFPTHESSSKSRSWGPRGPRGSWGPSWPRGSSHASLSRDTDRPKVSFAPLHRQKDKVTVLGSGLQQSYRQPQGTHTSLQGFSNI